MNATIKASKRQRLTLFERIRIEILYKEKYSPSQIAKILCRHISSISREIRFGMVKLRNIDWSEREEYSAYYAEIKHNEAKFKTGRKPFYIDEKELLEHIQSKLDNNYSPDAVTGKLHKEEVSSINTHTVYHYISMGIPAYKNYNKRKGRKKNKALKRLSLKNIRGQKYRRKTIFSRNKRVWTLGNGYSSKW